jgi:catechol-2,3-dioxygenase
MGISVRKVGHVVLKVRDLERSAAFYRDVIGLKEVARGQFTARIVFFSATGENHHDLALLRVGDSAPSPIPTSVGLYHVAVQLADWDAVKQAHALLAERGLLRGTADHGVSRSLYTADPDGNEIELYCDTPREEWEGRVDSVMTVKPLALD